MNATSTRHFIFSFIFFSSFSSIAQDSSAVFKRWSVGITLAPENSFRRLAIITPNSATSYVETNRNSSEIPMIGYSAGASVSYFFKKPFVVSAGISYSQRGFRSEYLLITDINGNVVGKSRFRNNFNYIDIPLKASFILGKKKIRLLGGAGLTPAFLLYEQSVLRLEYNNGHKTFTKGKPNYINNSFNLFLTASIGIDIKLGKKMGLRLEPSYNYGLLRTVDAPVTEYLWGSGLNAGWYIRF